MTRLLAYSAYAVGSAVFLAVAVHRDHALLAGASALFLLGTLALLVPTARSELRSSRDGSRYTAR